MCFVVSPAFCQDEPVGNSSPISDNSSSEEGEDDCDIQAGYGYLVNEGAALTYVAYHFDFEDVVILGDIADPWFDHAFAGIGVPLEEASSDTVSYLAGAGWNLTNGQSAVAGVTSGLLGKLTEDSIYTDVALVYQQEGEFDIVLGVSMKGDTLAGIGEGALKGAEALEKVPVLSDLTGGLGILLKGVGEEIGNIEEIPGAETLKTVGCAISEVIKKPEAKTALNKNAKAGGGTEVGNGSPE